MRHSWSSRTLLSRESVGSFFGRSSGRSNDENQEPVASTRESHLSDLRKSFEGSRSAQSSKAWVREMGPPPVRRNALPDAQQKNDTSNLLSLMWSILKESLGKDLTRITLPFFFNEPLSVLQKFVEDLEFAELLNKAASKPARSLERMLYVAAFAVSSYSGTNNRFLKPFNPLLGETFEFEYPEQKWRALAEKVVHHPTVVALHGEGERWTYAADADVQAKFWGRTVELIPDGLIRLRFDDGDEYNWSKVKSALYVIGTPHIEHAGTATITNLQSSLVANIKFEACSMFSWSDTHQVSCEFLRDREQLNCTLSGTWDKEVHVQRPNGAKHTLWQRPPSKPDSRYSMTRFAARLNELTPGLKEKLPPTDSRLRPDQRAMEDGIFDQVNAKKTRLEEKQRAVRKAAEQEKDPLEPRWFQKAPGGAPGPTTMYKYSGGYWQARKNGDWWGCRDIFSAGDACSE